MKKIKKLIVAIMAMAMVLGMLTVSASAAEDTVKVTVKWEGAGGVDTSLYGWNGAVVAGWPGDAMTKVDESTYTLDLKVTADTVSLIPNNSLGQTVDIDGVDTTKGDITITIGEKNADGKFEATVSYADTEAGVSTPVVAVATVAVIALAGVVVCMKKRAVAE